MSKLLASLVVGSGAATAAVGGTYLMRKGGGEGSVDSDTSSNPEAQTRGAHDSSSSPTTGGEPKIADPKKETLEFETLEKFKNEKGGKCAKGLFDQTSDIDFNVAEGTAPSENNVFGTAPTDEGANTKGCLIINWEKKAGSAPDNNWSGTFTWTWAFKNENKGFITFNVAKTNASGSNKQLDLTGGFYYLEKETTSNKWTIKWKKEVTSGKEFTSTNFEEKFPKAKDISVFQIQELDKKDYWGFVDGKDQLERISESVTEDSKFKKWSWTWKKDGSDKVEGWSKDFEWWNYIYDKNTFDLSTHLGSFSGTWDSDATSDVVS